MLRRGLQSALRISRGCRIWRRAFLEYVANNELVYELDLTGGEGRQGACIITIDDLAVFHESSMACLKKNGVDAPRPHRTTG